MNDFGKINALYEAAFGAHKPARSCVEVSRLPKDVLVEIEAIATYVLFPLCERTRLLMMFTVCRKHGIYYK